jgi:hypothetical protein
MRSRNQCGLFNLWSEVLRKQVGLLGIALLLLTGCSTTHHSFTMAPGTKDFSAPIKIVGLPLVPKGVILSPAKIRELEDQVDFLLQTDDNSRYFPIELLHRQHGDLAEAVSRHLSHHCSPGLKTEETRRLCRELVKATGCRYAVVPKCTRYQMSTLTSVRTLYMIPLGYYFVYGNLPFSGSVQFKDIPVYSLTLVDLQEVRILSHEIVAKAKEVEPDGYDFPKAFDETRTIIY